MHEVKVCKGKTTYEPVILITPIQRETEINIPIKREQIYKQNQ